MSDYALSFVKAFETKDYEAGRVLLDLPVADKEGFTDALVEWKIGPLPTTYANKADAMEKAVIMARLTADLYEFWENCCKTRKAQNSNTEGKV
jgi:hypothetical protein